MHFAKTEFPFKKTKQNKSCPMTEKSIFLKESRKLNSLFDKSLL